MSMLALMAPNKKKDATVNSLIPICHDVTGYFVLSDYFFLPCCVDNLFLALKSLGAV